MFQENPEFGVGIHPSAALGRRARRVRLLAADVLLLADAAAAVIRKRNPHLCQLCHHTLSRKENEAKTSSYDQVNRQIISGIQSKRVDMVNI